ncbi:FxsA family protein [Streptomyces sp. WMMC500]|uniref:FxsA family membrane protein n=1 Tax=Streptomyces sp. WMMC500 TaxID=3015154 RepID=UPI00248B34A8|nr:FxsA family membrane protein [Streptomyces sp. WMMC500]WBB61120.1 FxsA family protein [Streptomyces sp. WMMC500]
MSDRIPQPYEDPAGSDDRGAGPGSGRRAGPGEGRGRRPRRRRSLARTLAPLGVAAWALLELWLLIVIGSEIGVLGVFAVLVGGLILGSVVIKRAGRRAWRSLAEQVQRQQSGAAPDPEADRGRGSGNGLTMLAGLLIMVPGLVTDAAGLLLLLPPVRGLVRRRLTRMIERSAAGQDLGQAYTQARIHRPDGKVVQGEVIREDDEDRPPGR